MEVPINYNNAYIGYNDCRVKQNILDYPSSDLEALEKVVKVYHLCEISRSRLHAVFGEGPDDAGVMIITEAPSAGRDERRRPFLQKQTGIIKPEIRRDREADIFRDKCRETHQREKCVGTRSGV